MALRQSQFRPGVEHRPGFTVAACDVRFVGLVVIEEIELNEFDALQLQLIECAIDPVRVWADHLGIGQKPCRGAGRGIAGSPIIRPILPGPRSQTLGLLSSKTTSGGVRHLPYKSLLSGLRHLLNIPLQEHLRTIFRGVYECPERALPGTAPKHPESHHNHTP